MKMPIVSVNQMAMNESVAATCCYKADMVNGSLFETVLSGGYLSTNFVNTPKYLSTVDASWLQITGDYTFPDNLKLVSSFVGGKWVQGYYDGTTWVPLTSAVSVGGQAWVSPIADLRNCDHKGTYCSYVDYVQTDMVKTHVGATVEHTAGTKDWAKTHNAVRFNS